MRGESDGEGEPDWSPGRTWALAVIVGVLGWLLLTGGVVPGLAIVEGKIPGTRGILTVGHVVMIVLIAVILNFVLRMPRSGGPLAGGEDRAGGADSGDVAGEGPEENRGDGEFPETGAGGDRVSHRDRPVD
jgi:hypothetical protein